MIGLGLENMNCKEVNEFLPEDWAMILVLYLLYFKYTALHL